MPWSDFFLVVRWWGTLFLVGAAAYPLTKRLFKGWFDAGYLFSKAVGMAVVGWIVYIFGTIRILPFGTPSILASLFLLFAIGLVMRDRKKSIRNSGNFWGIFLAELFFFGALLSWSWVKAHEPSIRGLEKFMDYGFMKSILNSSYFPPPDMWYAGKSINYYYFGHLVTAFLTKLSGIDLSYTFNLMLATIFALTLTMSFSIGRQLLRDLPAGRQVGGALLTAFLVTLAGNMQTLYAFTRGYTGDNVQPFWNLFWQAGDFFTKLPEGLERYWYANATRFIPFTIHEFPSYSFVVSDVHGHVLSIPFVLLTIALLIVLFIRKQGARDWQFIFYGFLTGILLMTNALDGPIYFGLLTILLIGFDGHHWTRTDWIEQGKKLGVVALAALLTALPFLWHFESFVSGIAINCPPAFLSTTKIGPLIFEGAEKCQKSPLWMMLILWGFFLYCGIWFILRKNSQTERRDEPIERVLNVFFLFSLALIIFPEFFYFKDIYPAHFRSNTMFKLGYQAFILFSIVAGYTIVKMIHGSGEATKKKLFFILLAPQLLLVSIYPIFSVRSYFNSVKSYEGLYGFNWLAREYPDDYAAITWLRTRDPELNDQKYSILVEADGDSYTDYGRFSAFTGIPTIIGWPVHEWLWRGSYDVVAPRREVVRLIYESDNRQRTQELLKKFNVRFIVVGILERKKYPNLVEEKFSLLGKEVFRQGETVVYALK